MEDDRGYPYKPWIDAELGSTPSHPDAPKFERSIPSNCRDGFLFMLRAWIVKEQISRIRRYGADERLYNHQLGYLLCLSNLMELLNDIEGKVACTVSEYTLPEGEYLPDRDF